MTPIARQITRMGDNDARRIKISAAMLAMNNWGHI
jgi:hypothetical protein